MSPGARGRGVLRPLFRGRGQRRDRGQSLVEFALVLPVLLLLALIAVDFGRIYLGWINLQNMARIGANYAANNPPGNGYDSAEYAALMTADAQATNCPLAPGQPAAPSYVDTGGNVSIYDIGDRASVTLTCRFHVITPLISLIVGSDVNVTVTVGFPIKSAIAAATNGGGGGGGGCTTPTAAIRATPSTSGGVGMVVNFMDSSGGGTGTSWLWDFGDPAIPDSTARDPGDVTFNNAGTWTVTLKVSNTCGTSTTNPGTTITVAPQATPKLCVVPNFTAQGGKRISSEAPSLWSAAGFTTTIQVGTPGNGSDWKIKSQSIVAGTSVPCSSTITVSG